MPDIIGNQASSNLIKQDRQEEVRLNATSLFVILFGAVLGLTWLSVFIVFVIR